MRKRTFKPGCERLETRELMAGNVLASFTGQNLTLTEAEVGLDNAIKLSNRPGAVTRVEGILQADGTRSLINGAPYQDFQWVWDLTIKFGKGNDQVAADPYNTPSYQDVYIDLASPPPVLTTTVRTSPGLVIGPFTPIFVASGPDNDLVDIGSLTTSGSLSIYTGVGNDRVSMTDFNIGGAQGNAATAPRNLTINTGAGADTVFLGASPNFGPVIVKGTLDIQTYRSLSETDADAVTLNYVTFRAGTATPVRLGGGNDTYESYATSATVDAGAGNDHAKISWGTHRLLMGDGDDLVEIYALTAGSNQEFRGGNGTDSIFYQNILGDPKLMQLSEWEFINGRRTWAIVVDLNWNFAFAQQ